MTHRRTYLDHNASAPLRPEARAAMAEAMALTGNPSSIHAEGRRVRAMIEEAREKVAALVGADPRDVVFTSGGSEANATALRPDNAGSGRDAVLLVSAVEHASVACGGGFAPHSVRRLPVTGGGVLDLGALEAEIVALRAENPNRPVMVSVMLANNETGAVQPVAEAARIAASHGAVMHTDAVQAAGKLPVGMGALGVAMLSLSAHKIGGPQGVGALVLAPGLALGRPLIDGGGQEMRRRAGTENAAGIAGFGAAAGAALRDLPRMGAVARLRDRLEATLAARGATIFARASERLVNTCLFAEPGVKAETAVIGLDLAGIAVSAGAACSSGKVERSVVLEAMGVAPDSAAGAVRVSLGAETTEADIERFLAAWVALAPKVARATAA